MNFLIDAQLPRRLADRLRAEGHDVVNTLELAPGNRTTDQEICDISLAQSRVVITKESDFVDSFLIMKRPHKLLLVSTGNISNADLELLFSKHLSAIVATFQEHHFIEIGRTSLIVHE